MSTIYIKSTKPLLVVWSLNGPVCIVLVGPLCRSHRICPMFLHIPMPVSKSVSLYPVMVSNKYNDNDNDNDDTNNYDKTFP